MRDDRQHQRKTAVERYLSGEPAEEICRQMGRSQSWLFKWLAHCKSGQPGWCQEQSRRPRSSPGAISPDISRAIQDARGQLESSGEFCGAQAIIWRLRELGVEPVPSPSTVGRVLQRLGLTCRRHGRYEPKGTRYPQVPWSKANDLHESDFVGPCFIRGGLRFYSLNSADLATGRCAIWPVVHRSEAMEALWANWRYLGFPRYQQFDNEMTFFGSPAHPRGMGRVIRVCLMHEVEPVFIALGEPWRNGVVEKFNGHWRGKFYRRVEISSLGDLHARSAQFQDSHNRRWRYSKLGGKTPMQALKESGAQLRYPESPRPPQGSLDKPEKGRYHVVRLIRSDGMLDLFGEKFAMPAETLYEYVWATIEVASQRLQLHLAGKLIDERPHRLR